LPASVSRRWSSRGEQDAGQVQRPHLGAAGNASGGALALLGVAYREDDACTGAGQFAGRDQAEAAEAPVTTTVRPDWSASSAAVHFVEAIAWPSFHMALAFF
jgi:hypothetical protein